VSKAFRLLLLLAALMLLPPIEAHADSNASSSAPAASTDDQSGDQSQDQDTTGTDTGDTGQPAAPATVAPHDFASGVAALNADSFDDKINAVTFLSGLGDPRVVPVLQALADERLYARMDGSLIYQEGGSYQDAITGKPAAGVKPDDLSEVAVNNRLRGVLQGVLGQLTLQSPDAALRIQAAQAIADQPTPNSVADLSNALAKETDPAVRDAMTKTLAMLDLQSLDKARRLAAVDRLKGSTDPNVRGQLLRLLGTETDAEVRKSAQDAADSISSRLSYIGVGVDLFEGLSLGSILLLAAIGLSITFGVMGVINMAHGEMIMLGAYSTFAVQQAFRAFLPPSMINAYLIAAIPIAFAITALVGIGLERTVIRFLYGRPLETLLATWGISLILQQGVRSIFGPDNQAVANPDWMTGGMQLIGGFTLTWNRLVIIFFCFAVLGALAAFLRYSSFGLHMRAVAQNRPMAAAMGIRTARIDAFTFGLGSGIAGIAGVALSQIGNVSPNLGQIYIVNCFMVVVFGGVGSLWGTLAAALSLGVATKFIEPFAGAIVGQILVLVFIILFIQRRPRGLFALKGRAVET
jgi:urea transport system permease protein